jgi:hypothetical protein
VVDVEAKDGCYAREGGIVSNSSHTKSGEIHWESEEYRVGEGCKFRKEGC